MPGLNADTIVPVNEPKKAKLTEINQNSAKKIKKINSPTSRSMGAGNVEGRGESGECPGSILTL